MRNTINDTMRKKGVGTDILAWLVGLSIFGILSITAYATIFGSQDAKIADNSFTKIVSLSTKVTSPLATTDIAALNDIRKVLNADITDVTEALDTGITIKSGGTDLAPTITLTNGALEFSETCDALRYLKSVESTTATDVDLDVGSTLEVCTLTLN